VATVCDEGVKTAENAWLSNDPQRGKRTTSQSSPLRIPLPPDHHKPETLSGHPLAQAFAHPDDLSTAAGLLESANAGPSFNRSTDYAFNL
jgi:hypothetical protein